MLVQETPYAEKKYLPIEDYAIIGDLYTIALVGKNGSIDWCCLPHFDSPSVFGALLDACKGGSFRISPQPGLDVKYKQLYVPETNILVTRFLSVDGVGEMTDFMPIKHDTRTVSRSDKQHIVRSLKVIRGTLSFEVVCKPAFNYARDTPRVNISEHGLAFRSADLHLGLATNIPLHYDEQRGARATFTLQSGESARFLLSCCQEYEIVPEPFSDDHYYALLHETLHYWRTWLAACKYQGRWREMVQRSALVLKLLTYAPTGAIVASPTTSLPETIGGRRNWDYRYTWLRDASYTIYSLRLLGFNQEAEAFMQWLDLRCHEVKNAGSLQPIYGIKGQHDLEESVLDHLEGYCGSRPVRIGNAAYKQLQLDIYGELMDAVYLFNRHTPISYDLWSHLRYLLEWLREHWQEPDAGIWERRTLPQRYVHSRAMTWVAFDRALRLARQRGLPAPTHEWMETSARVYVQIMEQGWSEHRQSFVQTYDNEAIDASSLLMILTKFAGPTDPRMVQTIKRVRDELANDVLVYRYDPRQETFNDLIDTASGTYNPCSFWLAESLASAGYLEDARWMLEKMLTYCNHVGLYSEEIGLTGEALGNYPHAFTHLSLITACCRVDELLNEGWLKW